MSSEKSPTGSPWVDQVALQDGSLVENDFIPPSHGQPASQPGIGKDVGMTVSSMVPGNLKGQTLISYLSSRFRYLSIDEWTLRIGEGRVTVDGVISPADTILAAEARVAYAMPDFPEPPCDFNYSIVYEDAWLLGINKTGNLLVHRSGMSFRSNLIHHLRYVRSEGTYPDADMVNRLDRETSGVVLVAKNGEALAALNRGFARQHIEKEYCAVTQGIPVDREGVIDGPIGKGPEHCRFVVDLLNGKPAETAYRLEYFDEKRDIAVVRAWPKTGRTHQIRVHLASIGCPIIGDSAYGSGSPLIARQALHCASTAFRHPITGEHTIITAPIPVDMQSMIDTMHKETP